MTSRDKNDQSPELCDQLLPILLGANPDRLERLAQFALSSLLKVPFRNARAGDQRGGDGGVSGIGGRHLVFEARRYRQNTRLDERSIRGEIDQAVERQPDLEAWLLVTTQEVPEQIHDAIGRAALDQGVGAISIDWLRQPLPKLAVLAASCPDFFAAEFGQQHKALLEQIAELPGYAPTLQSIERELQSWSIGYDAVRDASHRRVREIWNSRRRAQAKFNQDVAGGEDNSRHIRRSGLIDRLDAWFDGAHESTVGALVGLDGSGKTWAAVDWLQLRLDRLPIILLAPSSALGNTHPTHPDLVSFIARALYEISEVRDVSFWERRVLRLLARPADEGPTFLLFFDGLNQHPSCDWIGILQQLEDDPFHQRAQTLISTRMTFFDDRLDGLRRLIAPPCRVDIGNYDLTPGGEFDQKLALADLSRKDLPDDLMRYAAVPRMFDLIVHLKSELGGVQEVTVHRLLWAYGASAIPASSSGAFSEKGWRRFLLELATEYRHGSHRWTRRRIEALSASATLGPDQIYRRVSGVIDSIFTNLDRDGDPQFNPEFVYHALGLALVDKMKRGDPSEDPTTVLDRFLDPIAGYDGRAETLRAAVSIALLRNHPELPTWLGTLCTYWLHSQNLPESHRSDLQILAPKLVTPILDVIEASCGHSLTTPRHIAITALAMVDPSDPRVAAAIAERGCRWQSCISLEMRGNESNRTADSFHARRCNRLRERIGVAEPDTVTIAGREFEIVDYSGDDLIVATAQLLQGRPLKEAIDFFVRGAIHSAVVGSGAAHETQSWLNILNTVDPEDTAAGLRSASQAIRSLAPEVGNHPDLTARIASILLWRTGYSEDAEEAWRTDPKIDHYLQYETDYLPGPSLSFFRLERRHAAQVLCDRNLPMFRRIERAKDALIDPSFRIPQEFVDELASVSESFDFRPTATGRGRTSEDLHWEQFSLALARCNPARLADRERSRLLQYQERPADQRVGSALTAPESMLLVGPDESRAIQALRERRDPESNQDEHTVQTNFLIAEIQSDSPVDQVSKILRSGLDPLDLYLGRACHSPSCSELDHLVEQCRGDERMLNRLATVLVEHDLDLSERAFAAFSGLLFLNGTGVASGTAWSLLASNEAERLGAVLDRSGWSWSCSKPHTENIMGSTAIVASNHGSHFSEFAGRIAPARLLAAVSQDERSREEIALAVKFLSAALSLYRGAAPESGLDIFHDQGAGAPGHYDFTIGDIAEKSDNENDILSFVNRVSRPEIHTRRRQTLIDLYIDAVRAARQAGAQLLHGHFAAEDFDIVLERYPEALDTWLEGIDPPIGDFCRRVRLAEGFFVALCEAVLKREPSRGIPLWHALRRCLVTRFVDHTGIDRLKYAPFMAPDCPVVDAVLEDLYALDEAQTDDDLFDIVVAARSSDRVDWLRQMISRDENSPCPAHRRRAAFIRPLLTRPVIAGDAAWPSGKPAGGYREIRDRSWIMGQREAFAKHWLRKFAQADTPEAAHASWLLFMASSDRRVRTWMSEDYDRYAATNGSIEVSKLRFFEQQRYRLKRSIADNEEPLPQNFSNKKTTSSLMPWRAR